MLGLTDWLVGQLKFGEEAYLGGSHAHEPQQDLTSPRPRLWLTKLPLIPRIQPAEILLPANPSIHIFAIALARLES